MVGKTLSYTIYKSSSIHLQYTHPIMPDEVVEPSLPPFVCTLNGSNAHMQSP
jgi:hypothetical protein